MPLLQLTLLVFLAQKLVGFGFFDINMKLKVPNNRNQKAKVRDNIHITSCTPLIDINEGPDEFRMGFRGLRLM